VTTRTRGRAGRTTAIRLGDGRPEGRGSDDGSARAPARTIGGILLDGFDDTAISGPRG
jgi:hypothetical protein